MFWKVIAKDVDTEYTVSGTISQERKIFRSLRHVKQYRLEAPVGGMASLVPLSLFDLLPQIQ